MPLEDHVSVLVAKGNGQLPVMLVDPEVQHVRFSSLVNKKLASLTGYAVHIQENHFNAPNVALSSNQGRVQRIPSFQRSEGSLRSTPATQWEF